MSNVEWLLREGMDERQLQMSERTDIDDERWRATIERLRIGPGLRIFLTDVEARRDVTVEPRDDGNERWVGSQVTVSGRADIDFLDGRRTHATADRALLFRPSGRRAAYSLKAGTRFHSAGYTLNVERIERLFEGDVPATLRPLLDRDVEVSRIVAMPASRQMRTLAGSLFARGLNGPLRTLMMEGAVIQLLAVQAAAAERPPPTRRGAFSPRERAIVAAARERLLADMRAPPSLGELAAAAGLTEKRLNACVGTVPAYNTAVYAPSPYSYSYYPYSSYPYAYNPWVGAPSVGIGFGASFGFRRHHRHHGHRGFHHGGHHGHGGHHH